MDWIPAPSCHSPCLGESSSSRQKQPILARIHPPSSAPAQAGVPGRPAQAPRCTLSPGHSQGGCDSALQHEEQVTQALRALWGAEVQAPRHKNLPAICEMPSSVLCLSLFGNEFISSIINHLAVTVAELNPLNLLWDQPQGRRQVSREYIREKADRELGWEETAPLHSAGPFPAAVSLISKAQRRVRSIMQTSDRAAPGRCLCGNCFS